ncbi:MAG: Rieske 2Fe-2S domain-containing protein [Alphaproteobacteria bacterium]|nr:Rieske 2Fe-2S domain-containing protein [Alphaproteobacteria bacterium]
MGVVSSKTSLAKVHQTPTEMGYHRCWFPVCLSAELTAAAPVGRDFLGTRVVAYRSPAGKPVVQSAWCPHLGADLSIGAVIDGRIRCAYHHWSFDAAGPCEHIPTGDKIPPGARLATYPSAEAWGLIWVFNGDIALFGVPRIPEAEEDALAIEAHLRGLRPIDPWVGISNGVDFQHLRTLHGLSTVTPETISVGAYGIDYEVGDATYRQRGRIVGTNSFAQHLTSPRGEMFMLFSAAPIRRNLSRSFFVIGVHKAEPGVQERLTALRELVDRLNADDTPVLETIRFRRGVLVAADRHLARFFKYVETFPRARPAET